jgi:hypothetical protein
MNTPRKTLKGLAALPLLALTLGTLAATPTAAGSLENMERERAILIDAFLDPGVSPAERGQRIDTARHRLIDLERMVLRDDGLVGRNTPTVKRAFDNYDLTFLVHAAIENDMAISDSWLQQVGLTTQALMAASKGRR